MLNRMIAIVMSFIALTLLAGKTTDAAVNSSNEPLWTLLSSLEGQLPFQQNKLETFFHTKFRSALDHNKRKVLIANTAQYTIEVHPKDGTYAGDLAIKMSTQVVKAAEIEKHLPGGWWTPPPPPWPGVPKDLANSYAVDRPWGQFWFVFHTGDRLTGFSMSPGQRGSPGV